MGPTLYYGAGAGAAPTASAVVADIIDLARAISRGQQAAVSALGVQPEQIVEQAILPIEAVHTAWYLRMTAEDKPGVLSEVARICSESGISIEALIQKEPEEGETRVALIILTNRMREAELISATAEIEALPGIEGSITRIRVESLG